MSRNILAEKLKQRKPHVYIRPDITNVRVLEFYKAAQVFEASLPASRKLKRTLRKISPKSRGLPGCTMAASE